MTDDRKSGLALIAGSVGVIITLSLHPSGHITPDQIDSVARRLVVIHGLALACIPLLFLGVMGLSQRLASADRLALAALALYGFALLALMNAAVFDGLVSPDLLRQIIANSPPARDGWRMIMQFNGYVDQAFGKVFLVAASAALILWSASIVRSRALAPAAGYFGGILGLLALAVLFSGQLQRSPHVFSLLIVCQVLWFMTVGGLLCSLKAA
jgi:hypothetical protein